MELIDKDALVKQFDGNIEYFTANEMIEMIENAPVIDAVEVVRCKDCKYRNTNECSMWVECCDCKSQWSWESDSDFCSYGAKMESEER